MENNDSKRSKWQFIERGVLILTFICTAVATIYAVRTSQQAIQQAANTMRPWVTVEGINTLLTEERMVTKFQIKNIGILPAYVRIKRQAYHNNKEIVDITSPPAISKVIMMPNQVIYQDGVIMYGDLYRKILKRESVGEIIQTITVNYGISREKTENYFIYQKVKFDQKEFPRDIRNPQKAGIWNIEESDFK